MNEPKELEVHVPRLAQCDDCKEFNVCIFEDRECPVLKRTAREPTSSDCIACGLVEVKDVLISIWANLEGPEEVTKDE